jgi:hypothetical protein
MNERVFRIVSSVLVGLMLLGIVAGFVVILTIPAQLDQTEIDIACVSARANIAQLEALTDISESLGLPTEFVVPDLPPECV